MKKRSFKNMTAKRPLRRLLRRFALVVPAIRADTVRLLYFMAIGALGHGWLHKEVMRSPRAGPLLRMPSFRVRHSNTPLRRLYLSPLCGRQDRGRIVSGFLPGKLLFFQPVLLEARERGHAMVHRVSLTPALFVVQVGSAARAEAAAFALADYLYGQLQQHLFL
jgi:hypothetical protein